MNCKLKLYPQYCPEDDDLSSDDSDSDSLHTMEVDEAVTTENQVENEVKIKAVNFDGLIDQFFNETLLRLYTMVLCSLT